MTEQAPRVHEELSARAVYRACDPEQLSLEPSVETLAMGHERALAALDLALRQHRAGYHVFVVGPRGLGKRTLVREIVRRHAAALSPAADWCYLPDLATPSTPRAVRLAPGAGAALRDRMRCALEDLTTELAPHAFGTLSVTALREMVERHLQPVRLVHAAHADIAGWIDDVERDLLAVLQRPPRPDDGPRRYDVTLIASHDATEGAPVVDVPFPTRAGLVGHVDHQLGSATESQRIHAGALHRANGGFLLVDAFELARAPDAGPALVQALKTRQIRIANDSSPLALASLEPEPIPLDVKAIVFGDRDLYDQLLEVAPDLPEVFGVVAELSPTIARTTDTEIALGRSLVTMALQDGLRSLDRPALARVIEHASRLAEDAGRLSLHRRSLADLLLEAHDAARRADHAVITRGDVEVALDARRQRTSLYEQSYLDSVRDGTIVMATSGREIGRVNALAVASVGDRPFGGTRRISARTRLGGGEVVDIEREVDLGGPLHSKGVLILAGLLGARFGAHVPTALAATIVFEQSHEGVEGDSASLAEACALLSAIGEFPIRQDLAVTGAISQHGDVLPVGGVNEKIEGFHDVCRVLGLSGTQGVIIPRANVQHLMLRQDVVTAIDDGRFHVHVVDHVDDAIAIMSGQDLATIQYAVETRLAVFAEDLHRFQTGQRSSHPPSRTWSISAQSSRT